MFTVTFDENLVSDVQAQQDKKQFSGFYEVEIKSAYQVVSKGGTKGVKLYGYLPERKKTYELDTLWIEKADGTPINFQKSKLMKIFAITGANPANVAKHIEKVYGKMEEVPTFIDLIGADVGLVIRLVQKYKQTEVNGKWVDDKSQDPRPNFIIYDVCHPKTKQTVAERKANSPAKVIDEKLADLEDVILQTSKSSSPMNIDTYTMDGDDDGLGDL